MLLFIFGNIAILGIVYGKQAVRCRKHFQYKDKVLKRVFPVCLPLQLPNATINFQSISISQIANMEISNHFSNMHNIRIATAQPNFLSLWDALSSATKQSFDLLIHRPATYC